MRLTGPEHAAAAEALLLGETRWPGRIPDRMAAANAHATLALAAVIAASLVEGQVGDGVLDEWVSALPVPDLAAEADEVAAQWAADGAGG